MLRLDLSVRPNPEIETFFHKVVFKNEVFTLDEISNILALTFANKSDVTFVRQNLFSLIKAINDSLNIAGKKVDLSLSYESNIRIISNLVKFHLPAHSFRELNLAFLFSPLNERIKNQNLSKQEIINLLVNIAKLGFDRSSITIDLSSLSLNFNQLFYQMDKVERVNFFYSLVNLGYNERDFDIAFFAQKIADSFKDDFAILEIGEMSNFIFAYAKAGYHEYLRDNIDNFANYLAIKIEKIKQIDAFKLLYADMIYNLDTDKHLFYQDIVANLQAKAEKLESTHSSFLQKRVVKALEGLGKTNASILLEFPLYRIGEVGLRTIDILFNYSENGRQKYVAIEVDGSFHFEKNQKGEIIKTHKTEFRDRLNIKALARSDLDVDYIVLDFKESSFISDKKLKILLQEKLESAVTISKVKNLKKITKPRDLQQIVLSIDSLFPDKLSEFQPRNITKYSKAKEIYPKLAEIEDKPLIYSSYKQANKNDIGASFADILTKIVNIEDLSDAEMDWLSLNNIDDLVRNNKKNPLIALISNKNQEALLLLVNLGLDKSLSDLTFFDKKNKLSPVAINLLSLLNNVLVQRKYDVVSKKIIEIGLYDKESKKYLELALQCDSEFLCEVLVERYLSNNSLERSQFLSEILGIVFPATQVSSISISHKKGKSSAKIDSLTKVDMLSAKKYKNRNLLLKILLAAEQISLSDLKEYIADLSADQISKLFNAGAVELDLEFYQIIFAEYSKLQQADFSALAEAITIKPDLLANLSNLNFANVTINEAFIQEVMQGSNFSDPKQIFSYLKYQYSLFVSLLSALENDNVDIVYFLADKLDLSLLKSLTKEEYNSYILQRLDLTNVNLLKFVFKNLELNPNCLVQANIKTPLLIYAALYDHIELVKLLIDHKDTDFSQRVGCGVDKNFDVIEIIAFMNQNSVLDLFIESDKIDWRKYENPDQELAKIALASNNDEFLYKIFSSGKLNSIDNFIMDAFSFKRVDLILALLEFENVKLSDSSLSTVFIALSLDNNYKLSLEFKNKILNFITVDPTSYYASYHSFLYMLISSGSIVEDAEIVKKLYERSKNNKILHDKVKESLITFSNSDFFEYFVSYDSEIVKYKNIKDHNKLFVTFLDERYVLSLSKKNDLYDIEKIKNYEKRMKEYSKYKIFSGLRPEVKAKKFVYILNHYDESDIEDKYGNNILSNIILSNFIEILEIIVEQESFNIKRDSLLKRENCFGLSPLKIAVLNNNARTLELLGISDFANIKITNLQKLVFAITSLNAELFYELIEIDDSDYNLQDLLLLAIEIGAKEFCQKIINDQRCNILQADRFGRFAIEQAVNVFNPKIVEILLDKKLYDSQQISELIILAQDKFRYSLEQKKLDDNKQSLEDDSRESLDVLRLLKNYEPNNKVEERSELRSNILEGNSAMLNEQSFIGRTKKGNLSDKVHEVSYH